MKLHRLTAVVLVFCLMLLLIPATTPVQAVEESDVCIEHTPLMVENHFRYLNEIYIEKYPEMGLQMNYGFPEDWRIMAEHANSLVEGCATDREKADAIITWIVENIDYDENCNAVYSYDTLYDGIGNCLSQAMLMQDLCRSVGIPAVWGDGIKGDMTTMTVQDVHNTMVGHAWCFVYLDGEWLLYDPVWGVHPYTDKDMIAQDYFLDTVEGITPVYDSNNQPAYRHPDSVYAYVDGRFMLYGDGKPSTDFVNSGHLINLKLNLNVTLFQENNGQSYVDEPERMDEMIPGEMFTKGWFAYGLQEVVGENWKFYVLGREYARENGIRAYDVLLNYDDEPHFNGYRMIIPLDDCRIQWGWLTIRSGYTGQVLLPYGYEEMKNDPRVELVWESDNPEVTSVDENGVVTNHQEGVATVYCYVYFNFRMKAPSGAEDDPAMVEQLLQDGFVWEDGKLVMIERRLQDTFGYHASYEKDISRPTKFGKENTETGDPQQTDPEGNDAPIATMPPLDITEDIVDESEMEVILAQINELGKLELAADTNCNALTTDAFLWEVVANSFIPVEIAIGDAVLTLDSDAARTVYEQSPTGTVTVELVSIETENLTPRQHAALASTGVEKLYAINIRSIDHQIHELAGTATVRFPFVPKDGTLVEDYKVYCVSDDGTLQEMEMVLSDGCVTFTTNHFSVFALVHGTAQMQTPDEPETWPIYAACGVILVVALVLVLIILRKRKN